MSHITGAESIFQKIAESLARFEEPEITRDMRRALWMNIGDSEALDRLCNAVSEYSQGAVTMAHVTQEERDALFGLEVMGQAVYFVLRSGERVQPMILTADCIVFDNRKIKADE